MKKALLTIVLASLLVFGVVNAATILFPYQGGTGTSTAPTAGDVLVGASGGIYGILNVGSNGKVLTASSTATFGVSWETSGAGAGITSLNGLTGASQTFATTTSADTFTIVSTGTAHTFTIPSNVGFFSNDSGYLVDSNNLSDLASTSTAVTNLGLDAGGPADIWVEKAGDTMSGPLAMGGFDITGIGTLGTSTARLTEGWFSDLDSTTATFGTVTISSYAASPLAISGTATSTIYGDGTESVIGGGLSVGGAMTATSYGGITEANLVDKSVAETISGQWNFARYTTFTFGDDTPTVGPFVQFKRSRAASADVQDGDDIGELRFWGKGNGTDQQGAQIIARVDGTPGGATDMPSSLLFTTSADGSATPTTRLTIGSDGVATFTETIAGSITGNAATVTSFTPASGSLTLAGADALTLTTSAGTNVTLPTTGTLATLAGTETFTNKRITPRVKTFATDATPDINSDDYDAVTITAQAAAITDVNVTGTPTNFQKLLFRIKDNGTARAITWGTDFENGVATCPTTTVESKTLMVGVIYDSVDSKWACDATGSRE